MSLVWCGVEPAPGNLSTLDIFPIIIISHSFNNYMYIQGSLSMQVKNTLKLSRIQFAGDSH